MPLFVPCSERVSEREREREGVDQWHKKLWVASVSRRLWLGSHSRRWSVFALTWRCRIIVVRTARAQPSSGRCIQQTRTAREIELKGPSNIRRGIRRWKQLSTALQFQMISWLDCIMKGFPADLARSCDWQVRHVECRCGHLRDTCPSDQSYRIKPLIVEKSARHREAPESMQAG